MKGGRGSAIRFLAKTRIMRILHKVINAIKLKLVGTTEWRKLSLEELEEYIAKLKVNDCHTTYLKVILIY